MSEQNTPEPAAEQAKTPAPPPEVQNEGVIRQMREQLEHYEREARQAREDAKLLDIKLKERQRAEMSKEDQMRAEIEELRLAAVQAEQDRQEVGQWNTWAERDYEAALSRIEDIETRENLRRMTGTGDWRHRLEALKGAQAIYTQMTRAQREAEKATQELERAKQQTSFGTRTQPGVPRAPAPVPPTSTQGPIRKVAWEQVLTPVVKRGRPTEQTET